MLCLLEHVNDTLVCGKVSDPLPHKEKKKKDDDSEVECVEHKSIYDYNYIP